jgi:uncharacterized protein YdaU (DUF1376 family)
MAKDDHWFKFYYRLIVISCQGWRDDEFGAYVRLLIHQFDKGGLPKNPAEIAKLITSFKKNWPLLSTKFTEDEDGLLRNRFMKDIRDERDKKSAVAAVNGKTGGRGNKKADALDNKAKALKNESNILSPSLSSSVSKDEVGPGGEESFELPESGFMSNELPEDFSLRDTEIQNTITYLGITAKKVIDIREVKQQWEAFLIKQRAVQKWYNGRGEFLNHFRDSYKLELGKNGNNTKKSVGKDLEFDRP